MVTLLGRRLNALKYIFSRSYAKTPIMYCHPSGKRTAKRIANWFKIFTQFWIGIVHFLVIFWFARKSNLLDEHFTLPEAIQLHTLSYTL